MIMKVKRGVPTETIVDLDWKCMEGLQHSLYIAEIERNKATDNQGQIKLYKRLQDFHTDFPIVIQRYTEDHGKHKETFPQYIAQLYGLKSTKEDLMCLLHHPISPRIIQLARFEGLVQQGSWSAMNCFRRLLEYVPRELTRCFSRLIDFWEELAELVTSKECIYRDIKTASRIAGRWPAQCEVDRRYIEARFKCKDNPIFPLVKSNNSRLLLQEKLQTTDHRIPSLGTVIAEAHTLKQITQTLQRALVGGNLQNSQIYWNDQPVSQSQYLDCFLAGARALGRSDTVSLTKELNLILSIDRPIPSPPNRHVPQSVFAQYRKVSAYPYGVWSSRNLYTVNDFFQPDMILQQTKDTCTTVPEELPLLLLLRDFWEGFFDKVPIPDPPQRLISLCGTSATHGKHTEIDVSQHHNSYVSSQDTSSEHLNSVASPASSDQEQHLLRDRMSNASEFDGSTLCGSDSDGMELCPVQWRHPMFVKDLSVGCSRSSKTQPKLSAERDSGKPMNNSCRIIKMESLILLASCIEHMR